MIVAAFAAPLLKREPEAEFEVVERGAAGGVLRGGDVADVLARQITTSSGGSSGEDGEALSGTRPGY